MAAPPGRRMGMARLALMLLLAAQTAGAQTDSCAKGAAGRWAGTQARLLALDASKLPNLYARATEFMNITGATIDIEHKSIKEWGGAVYTDAKTARLYDGYVLKGSWVPELAKLGAVRGVSEYAAAEDRWGSLAWNDIAPIVQQFLFVNLQCEVTHLVPVAWLETCQRRPLAASHIS